ncbi:prepilin-type N-terminal cleavage/methylation domain-containing protein [uncultured Meiothermus sp.]|uniref:PilW family protein n=1 Tax=uncultured Meiothermus sp. TaxID=157471 RepID=UPI0026237634|nr:prepilin-type N-terminal cleavage/methylation domain-containing protein [uncultured Meiothermus sp.]
MRTKGLTILELMVALAIFGIVLAIATRFFASQSQDTRIVQERNEVQDRARLVLQMVSQDLILAGSSRFIRNNEVRFDAANWVSCAPGTPCLTGTDHTDHDTFVTRYHTSLYPSGQECRSIGYRFNATTLMRADVPCSQAPTGAIAAGSYLEFATQITQLNIRYVCGDSAATEVGLPSGCIAVANPTERFVRAALVTVTAASPQGGYTYTIAQRVPIRNLKTDEVL